MPWYAHHVTDPFRRHDDHLLQVVLPHIAQWYPAAPGSRGHRLLGFSKSGFGAMMLLARYPDLFYAAASWDAPLLLSLDSDDHYQALSHFGTPQHFSTFLPSVLFQANPAPFQHDFRIILAGHQLFGAEALPPARGHCHTAGLHILLQELGIKHLYRNDLRTPHVWHRDWLEPVVELLMGLS